MEQKMAVVIIDSEKDQHGKYIPCIVKEGEQGYFLTDWRWGRSKSLAQKLADDYNTKLGISKEEVMTIVLKSMKPRRERHHEKATPS